MPRAKKKTSSRASSRQSSQSGAPSLAAELAPLIAREIVDQLYADEWLDIHEVAAMVKVSRSRLDDLKALSRFPEADRWVAGKQVWNRLTIEEWKRDRASCERAADLTEADQVLLKRLRNERRKDRHVSGKR